MTIGANWGPSAGGTGTWVQSSSGGVMPPFSGFTRMAAGSFRDSQLLPSQPPTDAAKRTQRKAAGTRLRGRPARALLSEAIPCPCQNCAEWPTKRQKVLRCRLYRGRLAHPEREYSIGRSERAKYGQG